jgi:Uma2 family endonuclease
MSIAVPTTPPSPPAPAAQRFRRFTVAEFHRMIEAGVFQEDDPIELLEGWIVQKMVKNPRHDATVDRVNELIAARVPADWRVRVQSAITTADSEPEPDLAIVRGPASRYLQHHPQPADIALVVEVSDTSLASDREKARVYAKAAIAQYWIVNIRERVVEVFQSPRPADAAYGPPTVYRAGAEVPIVIAESQREGIKVDEIFEG